MRINENHINYLVQLHSGQWFGFDGEQIYENLWVKGYDKPTMQEIEQGVKNLSIESKRNSLKLSRRKFKIGISLYEIEGETLKNKIESALESLTEPNKTIAKVSYEDGTEFHRTDEMVVLLANAIGLTEEQVDDFFEWAMNEEWR